MFAYIYMIALGVIEHNFTSPYTHRLNNQYIWWWNSTRDDRPEVKLT